MDIPTIQINAYGLQNLVNFIFAHEPFLKEFGAIKIQLSSECMVALKKRKSCPPCMMIQQVTKIDGNELIYSVHSSEDANICIQGELPVMNETTFWSSLSCPDSERNRSGVSILPNKSFFCVKYHRKYFGIHRLPKQSLLKLAGKSMTDQFLPCLTRTYGTGASFPLACARQRLFSLVYHHEGGTRHWYIIPASERETLVKLIERKKSHNCLEHKELLIDPLELDKHHIRYHRLVQYPKEFVVLAAGALTQSFTESASWSESIVFALPSWIEEGHATAQNSTCQCNIERSSLPETIAVNLFRHDLIQKYITTHLKIVDYGTTSHIEDANNINILTMATTSNGKIPRIINMKPILQLNPIMPTCYGLPTPSILSPVNNWVSNKDGKKHDETVSQEQLDSCREKTVWDATNDNALVTPSIQSISDESIMEFSTTQEDQTITCTEIGHYPTDNNEIDILHSSFEDFMDLIPYTPATPSSMDSQFNEIFNRSEEIPGRQLDHSSSIRMDATISNISVKRKQFDETINDSKTLFVSGLRENINKIDIRRHFIGCSKVILKQRRSAPFSKYAFIFHNTSEKAERNLLRAINPIILGPECYVEHAYDGSHPRIQHQYPNGSIVAVNKIPENVSENDLRLLFVNCHLLKYCPACNVDRMTAAATNTNRNKALWGYAFLLYTDNQQVANVIENADQYQINGCQLSVSLCRNPK